jgi:glycosyltransferase involved in cell wall biosynthesis
VTVLVVSTVHQADDPRIRERTIRSLAAEFDVRYAAKPPAPIEGDDHEWVPLDDGRVVRWFRALAQMMRGEVELVSLHDHELIPAGLVARMLRRIPVVVDVHEDAPALILRREWVPAGLRKPLAWIAARLLGAAERFCHVTLAEPGYRRLFRDDHPVFPNYPAPGGLPGPAADGGYVVYVGDVTEARGALDMIEAVAAAEAALPLVVVGRCPGDIAERMERLATERGVDLTLTGWLPHGEAMQRAASASVGLSLLHDLPNYRHSMPTKLIEYLQLGIPVVASDLPGSREGTAGLAGIRFVEPGEPAAAAGEIDAVVGDAALRTDLAEGSADLRTRLVWPEAALRAFYRDLLSG